MKTISIISLAAFCIVAHPLMAEPINAISFSGKNNSYIQTPPGATYDSENFSFFAWVKFQPGENPPKSANLAGRWDMQASIFALCYGDNGVWSLFHKEGADVVSNRTQKTITILKNPFGLVPFRWTFVGVVVDGNTVTVHSGDNQESREVALAFKETIGRDNNIPFRIGGGLNVHGTSFKGEMIDISYWGRAVTAQELALIRNRKLTGKEPGLAFYYTPASKDDNAVTVVKDQGPKQVDGKLMNAEWVVSDF